MTPVTIRPITDAAAMRAVEELQRDVWGMPDLEIVPAHQLKAAVGAGGVILGAFDSDGTLAGFCYGFVGLRDGRLLFYSHMAGVRPEHQDRDIGFLLKRAQRQEALDRGLERMMWTFDPLQSLNASFNLHKLGATAARYYVDYYGEMPDAINRGLPSDRLEADWWLRDPRVDAGTATPRSWPDARAVLAGTARDGLVHPGRPVLELDDPILRLEIPGARGSDAETAHAWRLASRQAFLHYFGRGYSAVDYVASRSQPTGSYILERHATARRDTP